MNRTRDGRSVFGLALGVSLAAHAGFAAYWFPLRSGDLGSVDTATTAISVNLETTDVIDAMESAAAKQATSAPAGSEAQAKETKKVEAEQDDTAKSRPQIAPEAPETEKQTLAKETHEEKDKKQKQQQAAVAGGAGTVGSQDAEQSAGRISASQGSILNYGASLRAIISAQAPRTIRGKALRIAFNVAPSGELTSVAVVRSSRDDTVDRTVIELVRRLSATFPPPPKGATPDQLSYNIEIIFR